MPIDDAAVIEAVLFTMGDMVELDKLATAIDKDESYTRDVVEGMILEYENSNRGIRIVKVGDGYQMCTRPEYYENLIRVAKAPKKYALTDALLETLAIIAYKQPVTKLEIEKIRGVNSDHAVSKLVEYGLAVDVGRLDAPGRPCVFGTTLDFLRVFGIQSIDELPQIDSDILEDFKAEASREVGFVDEVESDGESDEDISVGV
ncbi:MAG TPA: SMC-Scp complex subunit ScpB [Eubacterium sp.]|nr:SMC-Scp complex subunit ScpB [Eubacterium sp.]HBZ52849.1 SMC-Scp complex subunit ScpB [Eubacterium sp.]